MKSKAILGTGSIISSLSIKATVLQNSAAPGNQALALLVVVVTDLPTGNPILRFHPD